jgi:hypothetical protein
MAYRLRGRRSGVEQLRWQLIFALSGVGAVMTACSGRSSQTVADDEAGGSSNAGGMSTGGKGGAGGTTGGAGGSGAMGGSGATGGTGGSGAMGGTGGSGAMGGAMGGAGGTGGSVIVTGGTSGSGGSAVGGTAGVGGGNGGEGGGASACRPASTGGQPGLCEGGYVHRPEPATCMLSSRNEGNGGWSGAEPGRECWSDDDCEDKDNGYCVVEEIQQVAYYCIYACSVDADCDEGFVCTCDNSYVAAFDDSPLAVGRCVSATCVTDADCDDGMRCIAPVDSPCGPRRATAFHCQTPNDECAGPDDCGSTAGAGCVFLTDRFVCQAKPACGRPFLVEGAVRQSELVASADWQRELAPLTEALGTDAREAVAAHFAEAGLMEHASVAAFARFSLQLLALGAPPELVRACTAAMADETRHAELCFGVAARYAGRRFAPGPLDVTGALAAVTLADVLELVVHEGCIGETIAALEANWAAEAATDPTVRDVLQSIAEDEGRHAALAFKFVAWAIEREPELAARVERWLAAAQLAGASPAMSRTDSAEPSELEGHGVLSPATRRAARRAALHDVLPSVIATALGSACRAPSGDDRRRRTEPVPRNRACSSWSSSAFATTTWCRSTSDCASKDVASPKVSST